MPASTNSIEHWKVSMSIEKKKALIHALEQKLFLKKNLPHMHGHKLYSWQREFIECENPMSFLVAGNQLGKSASQIIKAIRWATDQRLQSRLWKKKPTQFWYFYPSKDVATREFKEKWEKIYLPKGEYKDSKKYGWRAIYSKKWISELQFRSGVTIYFFTYEQSPKVLQSSTVDAIFGDEEMPYSHFNELIMRGSSNDGYFSTVFTATLGQEYLRRTMEEKGDSELFKDASKQNISAYDCLEYEDGTKSKIWTKQKIERQKLKLATEAEVQKRIYGRFVMTDNLLYSSFCAESNVATFKTIPADWLIYSGVDAGSGGDNHPAAIVFVGVSPSFSQARVFRSWRGDGQSTTAFDVVDKYKELSQGLNVVTTYYDYAGAGKDVGTIASRMGLCFLKANKDRQFGRNLLNSLFKNQQLKIYTTKDPGENDKLVNELRSLSAVTDKKHAKDDLIDALRYSVSNIPFRFEFSAIGQRKAPTPVIEDKFEDMDPRERYYRGLDHVQEAHNDHLQEVAMMFDEVINGN